jgi:hypothetical protein
MQSKPKRSNRTISTIIFAIVLLLWIGTITHDVLGFVPPVSAGSIGFDLAAALVWAAFLYCVFRLYRTFLRPAPTLVGSATAQKPQISSAPYTWTGDITGYRVGLQQPQTAVDSPAPITMEKRDIGPVGVGGWLRLLTVRLGIGTAVRLFSGLGGFSDGAYLLAVFNLGSAVLSGSAAYLLEKKNPKGVLLAKIYLALDAAYYLAVLVIGSSTEFTDWFKPAGYLLASVLYFAYLFRSRRVRNTYNPASPSSVSQAASA